MNHYQIIFSWNWLYTKCYFKENAYSLVSWLLNRAGHLPKTLNQEVIWLPPFQKNASLGPSSLSLLLLPCLLSKRLIAFHISHYDSQGQDKKRVGHKEQGPTSLQSALFKLEQDTLSVPRSMTWQIKNRLCPAQLATCETMHGSLSKKVEESIWAYYPCSHIFLKMAFPDLCFFRFYSFFPSGPDAIR